MIHDHRVLIKLMYIQKYLHVYRPVKSTKLNDKKTKMKCALKGRLFCYTTIMEVADRTTEIEVYKYYLFRYTCLGINTFSCTR